MNSAELQVVRYEVDHGVALVTLHRPERLNAWTIRMESEYRWALGEAQSDPEVRAVVVTGAGKGFCAGVDVETLARVVYEGDYELPLEVPEVPIPLGADAPPDFSHRFSYPLGMNIPVIAAINGATAGIGLVVACFADLRFAAAGAKLTTSFGRLGLPVEWGLSWALPRLVGPARAADLLFSSRVVTAEEAEAIGLVNRVLPPEELLAFSLDYARQIAAEISPSALQVMKRQLWAGLTGSLDEACHQAEQLVVRMVREPDFLEGVSALAEKRAPRFRPRS